MVSENLTRIREKIAGAAKKAARNPQDVTLICVAKDATTDQAAEAINCGVKDIGLNTVQDALLKYGRLANLDKRVKWHMIGHLQTNKAEKAVEIFNSIQSFDSVRLAEEINKRAGLVGKRIDSFIEVNIAGEPSKYGIAPEEAESFVKALAYLPHIHIVGLMTIAPLLEKVEMTRPYFVKMRQLRDKLQAEAIHDTDITELSMGMSRDFEVAIEEGATFVRIGTAIFKE